MQVTKKRLFRHSHCTENSKQIFPEMKLLGLVPNFCIHVSVSDLYIPTISPPILLYYVCGRSWGYVNRSQEIHECRNWEWGRAVSFLGIFVSNFRYSALTKCLLSRMLHVFYFLLILIYPRRIWQKRIVCRSRLLTFSFSGYVFPL